jgi:hypothetical protein
MLRLLLATIVAMPLVVSAQTFDLVRVTASGGKSLTSWHGQADLQGLNVEIGRSLSPRTTVGIVIAPFTLWQPRSWFGDQYDDGHESVQALSASLLLRRTFRERASVQTYLEGSSGPMFADKRVPAATSRFNFVSQAGAGVVFNAQGRIPIVAGCRFMHISNGGYSPRNPGLNVSAVVLGVQLRSASLRPR